MNEVIKKATLAKLETVKLGQATTKEKNEALYLIADKISENSQQILIANEKDVKEAKKQHFSTALIDRLTLTNERIDDMTNAMRLLTDLEDPIGKISWETTRPNQLNIRKVVVPLGVIGMIYEARPNVTVDATSLALKTGNAIILRGSSSTIHSNKTLVSIIHEALLRSKLPVNAVQLIENPDRKLMESIYHAKSLIDVLIPRGGKALIDTVVKKANVPVLETGAGNCHIYVDKTAIPDMTNAIIVNAKTQRPSVCNACESIVIHENWAKNHLKKLTNELLKNDVQLRGDKEAVKLDERISPATDLDWESEFLDLTLAVKVVPSIEEAMEHIQTYGTKHSEAIISEDVNNVSLFLNSIDASTVYHNASTRFTDGFEFGFGAEIGISTQKLHARGPMGLEALTTTKYHVYGNGQIK